MKRLDLSILFALVSLGFSGIAQTITPMPGSTVCPDQGVSYTINPNPDFSGCGSFTWTLTNGSFLSSQVVTTKTTSANEFTVTVYWKNVPEAGTLTVTSTCAEGGELSVSSKYAIRSLSGRTPANIRSSGILPLCSRESIYLAVDVMFLENTGGTTGVPQERADGYEWTLPSGWSFVGSSNTEMVSIVPDNDCRGGTVTVKAYKDCGSRKYSAPATINLDRPEPSIKITAPDYTGSFCGNTQPITFTVTPIACATDYTWNFSGPNSSTASGWYATPVSSGTNNYITVSPSGGPADAGSVTATITLDGCIKKSVSFPLTYDAPAITSSNFICYSLNDVVLSNVPPSMPVHWNLSGNMSIISGNGTPEIQVTANTSTTKGPGTISATVSCESVPVKSVWVGKPNMVARLDNGQLITHSSSYNQVCKYVSYQTQMQLAGSTFNLWQRTAANPSNTSWGQINDDVQFYFWAVGQTATFRLTSGNPCGNNVYDFKFKCIECSSDPCSQYQVSPNPSSSELNVVNIPAPCEPTLSTETTQRETSPTIRSLKLYDSNGQLAHSEEFENGTDEVKLDVSGLRKGVYILKVSNGSTTETHRVHIGR